MFIVFHILIFIILQFVYLNSFPIKREIYPDGKPPTENENFFKSRDDHRPIDSSFIGHNTLFQVLNNFSFTEITTQNSKSDLFDKMFSKEMISIQKLIYDKEKAKLPTPSLMIKQKWPVLEIMSKLSKNNNGIDYKDDSDVDFLRNLIFNDSSNVHKELKMFSTDQATVTDRKNITQTPSTASSTVPTNIVSDSIITYTQEVKDDLLHFQLEKEIRDQRTALKQDFSFDGMNRKKNIELRSLNHHDEPKKPIVRNSLKTCTCKKIPGQNNNDRAVSVKCTASNFYDNKQANLKRSNPCCTASNHQDNCAVSTATLQTQSISCPTLTCPPETSTVRCPPQSPATTCFPITTTTYYTTCYTIYPSTDPPAIPVNIPLNQNTYQPYYFPPYPLFIQAEEQMPQNEKKYKYKPPKKHTTKRRHKEDVHDLYYDYDLDNYDDFLDNSMVEKATTLKNNYKEVILQQHGCRKDKMCTRGVDDTDKNKFVDEVVTDLKKMYGNSVLKDCYCGLSTAACAFRHNAHLVTLILCFIAYLLIF